MLQKSPFGTVHQFALSLFHTLVDLLHQTHFLNTSLSFLVHANTHTEVHHTSSSKANSVFTQFYWVPLLWIPVQQGS
jgi:hypothetical protein